MKNSRQVVIAFVFVCVVRLNAQCGMYTYQDQWLDSSGNAIGENYAEADCSQSSTYVEVHFRMPSGYQSDGSASGALVAEAVIQASTEGESFGDGEIWGSSTATAVCWQSTSSFFDKFFRTAYTRVHWLGTQSNCTGPSPNLCDYGVESWCTPETTPPLNNVNLVRDLEFVQPLGYWETGALCVRILPGLPWYCPNYLDYALQTTGPGGVMPRAVCSK